jgi:hypothetical protein
MTRKGRWTGLARVRRRARSPCPGLDSESAIGQTSCVGEDFSPVEEMTREGVAITA